MNYHTQTLDSGLRVIHLPLSAPVVYCGYQIKAGARCEEPGEEGLAHFCEHMTFKGTQRRRAWNILNSLESVGGDLNAYTNKEDTCYYAAIPKEHTARAIDLLTDIVFHSVYPQAEINKEVEVICDEIESYNDSPAELIFDDFENLVFAHHPLGHNILGSADNVRRFTTDDALRFTRRYYRPDNAVFFVYGDVDFKRMVRKLEQLLPAPTLQQTGPLTHRLTNKPAHQQTNPPAHQPTIIDRGTHQAHVMLGNVAYSVTDERRMPLYVLNNMLGGPGMNARLNVILREHHGLVYTVESSMVNYGDTGLWCTYFGCDPHDVKRCLRLVRRELDRLMLAPITETRLRAAKKQLKGQISVACDNHESFALSFGKSYLHYGWERYIDRLYAQIDRVAADDILQVAREIFAPETMTTLIYR
jgi:Predicted Zn-dependent peptidases